MTWVRIDDGAPLHPKLLDAGPEAAWLWTCGLPRHAPWCVAMWADRYPEAA